MSTEKITKEELLETLGVKALNDDALETVAGGIDKCRALQKMYNTCLEQEQRRAGGNPQICDDQIKAACRQ